MGGTFVITLREGFEAALVLGLIYTYLDKIEARREFRYVTTGALLGVAASVLLGLMVTVLSGPLVDLGPDLIGAAVLFAASGTLTWHGWWMRQHARGVRGELEQRIGASTYLLRQVVAPQMFRDRRRNFGQAVETAHRGGDLLRHLAEERDAPFRIELPAGRDHIRPVLRQPLVDRPAPCGVALGRAERPPHLAENDHAPAHVAFLRVLY